jgi:hypothetical protein
LSPTNTQPTNQKKQKIKNLKISILEFFKIKAFTPRYKGVFHSSRKPEECPFYRRYAPEHVRYHFYTLSDRKVVIKKRHLPEERAV